MIRSINREVSDIGRLRTAIFTAIALLFFMGTIERQYFSVDARYAYDNLCYLTSRMQDAGIMEPGRAPLRITHPLNKAVMRIAERADEWTDGYLKFLEFSMKQSETGKVPKEAMQLKANPYDTLSRLVLQANSPDVEVIYRTVMFDAAMVSSPEYITEEMLHLIKEEKQEFTDAAVNAYRRLQAVEFISSLIFAYCLFFAALSDMSVRQKSRNSRFLHIRNRNQT